MPKSGFDPQRHQRKLHRHNPLAKSSASSSAAASPASVASSTLDALQQAAKGGGADSASPKSAKAAKAANNAAATNDIIPLLANLPAPDAPSASSAAAPINLADKVWALASVSLLLSVSPTQSAAEVKLHRKLLLSHNLVGRLILALHSHTEVDVRREASGALRNLCVDAGIDVRNELVNKGGIPAILAALRWASNALGFDAAPAASANPSISFVDDAPTQEQDIEAKRALLAKPLDKMNKKEKRHATKLATALGKTLEQLAGQGLSADDEAKLTASHQPSNGSSDQVMDTASSVAPAAVRAAEPFLGLDSNTRKGLVEMADNLVTLVWSLCESGDKAFAKLVSWKWLDHDIVGAAAANDELSGEGLASWLASAIALGSRAAAVLSTAGADGSRASSSSAHDAADALGVLSNEELSLLLDLALASGNALCALTDGGEADFVNGLLARKTPVHTPKAAKKKGASVPVDVAPVVQSIDEQPEAATRRLAAIQTAVSLLEACVQTDQSGIDKLKRYILSQSTMLGVLCAGVLRNVAAAVDSHGSTRSSGKARRNTAAAAFSSDNVFLPASSGAGVASKSGKGKLDASQGVSLKRFEEATVLPTLTRLLAGVDMTRLAHDLDGRGDVSDVSLDGSKDGDEAAVRAKMQRKAEEQAQTLMLALEVVAEMASSLDARAGADGDEGEWLEDLDAEDAGDDDMDMGDDDDDVPEDMEAMLNEAGDDDMRVDAEQKDTFADAVKRSGSMPFEAYAPVLSAIFGDASSLTDALLALARPFEASFPSLSGAKDADAATSGQLRGLHLRSLSVLNNLMLRLASFSPPPPSQPATEPKVQRRIAALRAWTQQPTPARTLGSVWRSLFDIAKGCASVPAVAGAGAGAIVGDGVVGSIGSADGREVGEGEGGDGMAMVETCIGTMWSVARIVEGNVELSSEPAVRVSEAGAVSSEVVSALVAGYASARSDAMRVKCVLLLSTIARAPAVHPNLNAHIGDWLVSLLEAIPERGSAGTTPESMVAAINGLIDVYADETATYDVHGFRQQGLLGRMRLTLFRCKALARTIDRRKQISLRASAEEALENLAGFIQYRQSLGL